MVSLPFNGRISFLDNENDVTLLRNKCYSAAVPAEIDDLTDIAKFKMQFETVVNSVKRQDGAAVLFNISTKIVSEIIRVTA